MNALRITLVALMFLSPTLSVFADEGRVTVSDVVNQMSRELDLTPEQVEAVRPIIRASATRYQDIANEQEADGGIDKSRYRSMVLQVRDEEDQKLSKVLTPEQMDKMLQKRAVRERLNKDKLDFSRGWGNSGTSSSMGTASTQF